VANSSTADAAAIALSVSSGSEGTAVTISGSGFPPGEVVAIYLDTAGPYLGNPPPGPTANAQGTFQFTFKWPTKNYDSSGRVDPTKVGPHTICGDTAYPNSTQPIPAKACAQFNVVAAPSAIESGRPGTNDNSGAPLIEVLVALAILVAIIAGVAVWIRRKS
jgi:hypothetical protein